jgi:phospholipid/cholesterol/gamma-HCH transport system permease protein
MNTQASTPGILHRLHHGVVAALHGWWRLLYFAVQMFSMALTPSSYGRAQRPILARHLVADTVSNLVWFGVLSALVSLVLIRIVVVTSQSYGLSRFALEMVVRVLVLELIPLSAAAFVALRTTLPAGLELAQRRHAAGTASGGELHREFFPRVAAGVFAVWMLAAASCVLTLILAYLSLYGFTPWALAGYTRVVGQVFNPAVSLILVLKIVFFSFAVGLIPMATSTRVSHDLADMARVFGVMLLIEVASLMGNYY